MFVVLLDNKNNRVCEWAGVTSVLELPVFSANLFSHVYKNISRVSLEDKPIYSNTVVSFPDNVSNKMVKNLDERCNKTEETTVIFFSERYIEVDDKLITILNSNDCNYKIVSKHNQLLCVVTSFERFIEIYRNYKGDAEQNFIDVNREIVFDGYSIVISAPSKYKNFLTDILNKKTKIILPEIAEGVFAEEKLPQGDFSIIPPVYFDKEVQIESGTVIGPNSILLSETLVSSNSNIKNSVISKAVYVSSGCYIDNSILFNNVSVRRNSAILGNGVLGHDCFVGEESIIEDSSNIRPYTRIDEFKKNFVNYKKDNTQSPAGFYGYTPEKAALLGAAIGKVFDSPKIAIASNGELNSTALRLSIIAGLITTGAKCFDFGCSFLSSLYYFMDFCELDFAVFISGDKTGTIITVFEKRAKSLTPTQYHNIKMLMTSDNIKRCSSGECKNVRQIHGMTRMYIQNIIKDFTCNLDFTPVFNCDNKKIQRVVEIAVSKIGCITEEKQLNFHINYDGTRINVEEDGVNYQHNKLLEIVNYYNLSKQKSLWKNDGIILCFELLKILQKHNITIADALESLPKFYIAEETAHSKNNISSILNKLADKWQVTFKEGDIYIDDGINEIRINKNNEGEIHIVARSNSAETAKELVGDLIEKLL